MIEEKSKEIEDFKKENWQLKVENVVLQKLSSEFDDSIIFECDKCNFEIEEEDALETHKELYLLI